MIAGQFGLATARQLEEAGWTRSAIRHARERGIWQSPYPGVVIPQQGSPDPDLRLAAAALWAGPRAVLTGSLALRRLGMKVPDPEVAIFLVPDSGRARQAGSTWVRRTSRPVGTVVEQGCIRIVPAVRGLADAAVLEDLAEKDLEHLTISVLQQGRTTPEELERELWQRPRAKVAPLLQGLLAFRQGAWSRPEGALRTLWSAHPDLPELITNCRLETLDGELIAMPDGYVKDAALAIQVHSRTHHQGVDDRGGDRWAQTVEHDSDMVAHGIRVLGVSPWTIYSRPTRFFTRLRTTLALPTPPPPRIRVVPLDPPKDR